MAVEHDQSPESDLDRTDKLPILQGAFVDPDVMDDAVPMDRAAELGATAGFAAGLADTSPGGATGMGAAAPGASSGAPGLNDVARLTPVDLPTLAESMRSVEERIERQHAEYDRLTRTYDRARESEHAAKVRANALDKELAAVRTALESERTRAREVEGTLTEKVASSEAARLRAEQASLNAEHYQAEARALRESVAARDATIAQVLHSLAERDGQLSALQAEHAKMVPALEARALSSTQLEKELDSLRSQLSVVSADLKAGDEKISALSAQLARNESEIATARHDLAQAKAQNSSYLEVLRTRDWRRGFEHNLYRDLDDKAGAADAHAAALSAERDRAQARVADLEATIAAHRASIEKLQSAAALQSDAAAHQAPDVEQAQRQRADWSAQLSAAQAETVRLSGDIAHLQTEHAAKLAQLEAEAAIRDDEMTVLMAHLQEARRPVQSSEGDSRRLQDEIGAKNLLIEGLTQEGNALRATLERTRAQLEEREFLIRRLERSESNNANVLGRIQTSMERLGTAAAPADWSPELVRIGGDKSTRHTLGRRTRIGRAPGCELLIDSSSVSRHHALILAGTREAIIEDLNSTNGVILNGRKVTRQVLNDGDILTIGEIQFRYVAKPAQPSVKE